MATLRPLLDRAARDLEPQVRAQLGGFFGGLVQAYLPQAWEFRAGNEVATLVVSREGTVTVQDGAPSNPDVTVEATLEELTTALGKRSKARLAPGSVRVRPHTSKGKTAFDYLRGRFGL